MTAKELLLYLLEYTYEREGAYPPLTTALAGLTAAQAEWKPAIIKMKSTPLLVFSQSDWRLTQKDLSTVDTPWACAISATNRCT